MPNIGTMNTQQVRWRVFLAATVLAVATGWIFYAWNTQWTRVKAGEDGWSPNAALAARTDSVMQAEAAHAPITDVLVLASGGGRALAGWPVQLDNVCVRWTAGTGMVAVSQIGTPVIIAALPGSTVTTVKTNQSINLVGIVRRAPDRSETHVRWPELTERELAALERSGVYIEASQIQVNGWY